MALLILLGLTCAPPLLIDYTGLGWNDAHGRLALANSERTCYRRYRGCSVRVTRVKPLQFQAICKRSKGI